MFSKAFFGAATACGLLVSSVNAHMVIRSPVPYGQASLNNSPLENDGSDFPCKQRSGVYDITEMNTIPVGVPQQLAFMGGATHGGGSCQVSVTLDKEPTTDSQWKVIHSIVGGCPANATENLSDDAYGEKAAVFEYSVPKGMPNGEYTLAWTWFNKIGNREMYMNCAPITVTGGADNNDVYDTLPDMFVINLPREECATTEMEDFVFPNPGKYVETAMKTALGSATTGSGCAAVTAKGAGKGSAGSNTAPAYAAPSATESPSYGNGQSDAAYPTVAPTASARITFPGVVKGIDDVATATTMATVTATGYSAPAAVETESASSYVPPVAEPTGYTASPGSNSGTNDTATSGSCSGGSVVCNSPGNVVCIGSSQWGLCDINNCAVPRELSTGTSCASGVVSKRHANHLQRHAHRPRSF